MPMKPPGAKHLKLTITRCHMATMALRGLIALPQRLAARGVQFAEGGADLMAADGAYLLAMDRVY